MINISTENTEKPLRVAMIAPPWLRIPVKGYGGVENVVDALTRALVKKGVQVDLYAVLGSYIPGARTIAVTGREEYDNILKPMYEFGLPAPCAHILDSLNIIRLDGEYDVIHDHNYFVGPSVLIPAAGRGRIPPAIHTIHGPPPTPQESVDAGVTDNRFFWRAAAGDHDCSFVSISDAMRHAMPEELEQRHNMLDTVYNAVDTIDFPFVDHDGKKNYFVTLGGFSAEKNQGLAAQLCAKKKLRLRMAGPIVDIKTNQKLLAELANPMSKYRGDRNFRYFSDEVLPSLIKSPYVSYSGMVSGKKKMKFLSEAKALLHPITWNEPFGMVIIEALACGTPVIAMNRGAMSEIIEHGVNGFLAETEEEFSEYLDRIDEIDPAACRRSVKEKFSAEAMADGYIARYMEAIEKAKARRAT